MRPVDPGAVLAAIRQGDPDVMDRDELAERTRSIQVLRAWCDAEQVRTVRAQRRLAEAGRAESPKDLLAREGRQSGKDARATDEREAVCSSMPGFEDALSAGAVSAGHLDAIANATRGLDQPARAEFAAHADGLLADAVQQGVDAFERACRDLARLINATSAGASDADELERQRRQSQVKRWTDPESGMRNTLISLDPVRDAQMWAAIDELRRALRRRGGHEVDDFNQLQVQAVIAAVTGAANAPAGGVIVLIDYDTLMNGVHAKTVCELADGTPLPVATVRRMACEMGILPVVLDGNGRALDVGMTQRSATEAQRMALRAMYRTCGYPGCDVAFDSCEIHHVVPVERGGPTDLSNLIPMCIIKGHHHQVHEGGWTLTMTPDRIVTVTRPDGTVWFTGTTVDRAPGGVTAA